MRLIGTRFDNTTFETVRNDPSGAMFPPPESPGIEPAYRYALWRNWELLDGAGRGGRRLLWICLNPSTADERLDDPTIRRCIRFSKAFGFGGMFLVNLFALRSKDPADLKKVVDPVGADNDQVIHDLALSCDEAIAAWGVHGQYLGRERIVCDIVALTDCRLFHLGLTHEGYPRHPLYLDGATQRRAYVRDVEVRTVRPGVEGEDPAA